MDEEPEARTPSPQWSWARLLKRVCAIDMARCPMCQQGTLRIIAVISELFHTSNLHLRLSKSVWSSPRPRRPQPRVLPLLLLQSPASRGLLPEAARQNSVVE